ncbi:MAG: HIT domain-containing protein [Nanoarchaeota archaeon]|nr:HIT domain-containing protein [Nanoarchaeota archaeon]
MTLTDKEVYDIKEHLLTQLDNFPKEKQVEIAGQINSMTNNQVENFIKQNKLTHLGGQCIFCSIIADKSPSFKIAENEKNIAILEINPLSKGHSLVIPKEHTDEIFESTRNLTQEISKKIQERLNPKEIKINELKIMNHALLEVVPIYGYETERRQATEEELKSIQEEIIKVKEIQMAKESEPEEDIPKIPVRIP